MSKLDKIFEASKLCNCNYEVADAKGAVDYNILKIRQIQIAIDHELNCKALNEFHKIIVEDANVKSREKAKP